MSPKQLGRMVTMWWMLLLGGMLSRGSYGSPQMPVMQQRQYRHHHRKLEMATEGWGIMDQYIVRFHPHRVRNVAVKREALLQLLPGASVLYTYETTDFQGCAVKGVLAFLLRKILDDPDVMSVYQDAVTKAATVQENPPWSLDRIDQPLNQTAKFFYGHLNRMYNYTMLGLGVEVFILDSGINFSHDDLTPRATCGYNAISLENCGDLFGHGTHISGIVGGTKYGVAKNVSLIAVKILSERGTGSLAGALAGLDYVMKQRGKRRNPMVANLSLEYSGTSTALNDAINSTVTRGVFVTVPSGNTNIDACGVSPASATAAVTVGGTTIRNARADFSNYGACVDIFAPGKYLLSDYIPNKVSVSIQSGTSGSCAFVAGAAALYFQLHPDWTPAQVWQAISDDAEVGALTDVGTGSPNRYLNVKTIHGEAA